MKEFYQTKLDLPPVKKFIKQMMDDYGISRADAKTHYNQLKLDEIWVNDLYQVNIARGENVPNNNFGVDMIHLSIKRLDKSAIHDWRHMQAIKDSLVGQENEGFELYPAASRLVDGANQFHMFVFADPEMRLPIGWAVRGVDYEGKGTGVSQRPAEEDGPEFGDGFEFEGYEERTQSEEEADKRFGQPHYGHDSDEPTQEEIDAEEQHEADKEEIDIDMILQAAAMMDDANVPEKDRIVEIIDPDTGEYVSSQTDPERVTEIIAKYVEEQS